MSEPAPEDRGKEVLCIPEKRTPKKFCFSSLKIFIIALSFVYFSKALCGAYMKSTITQIERRFDLASSVVGIIDGGFEMGNLLFMALVSHFGAALHRPRLIGIGCFLMAIGSALAGLPHFFMGRYKYGMETQGFANTTLSIAPCQYGLMAQSDYTNVHVKSSNNTVTECVKDPDSSMWICVFLGNALRGIGESPVTPLGISYVDDFAKAENSAFYIACLQTITLLGPICGFLLGSLCASLYVDIGFVDIDNVTITSRDTRWVGAWWLGFFVSSAFLLLAGIPFWFLPRSSPKQGEMEGRENSNVDHGHTTYSVKLTSIAKGFLPSLKRLLSTPIYFLLLCELVLNFNSIIGLFTFKAKYMEQQFGQSTSRANFLIGVLNLPAIAVGIFLGGLLMKRYKLSVVAGAQFSFITSLTGCLLLLLQFGTKCDNVRVAGLTVSYNGTASISHDESSLVSVCNRDCSCSTSEWNPVCSDSGITYTSPCFAGCTSSTGHGKKMVFHNCSCVFIPSPVEGSRSVSLGQCPRGPECTQSFTSYMAISVLSSFIKSLGTTPGYMVILRCIPPELKSLALGIQTLIMRTLGGITAPVYFGALIDSTCLKWGLKRCEGQGACRMYDSDMYRIIFLGLITCLSGCSYFFAVPVIVLLRKQFSKDQVTALQQATSRRNEIELQTSEICSSDGSKTDTSPRENTTQITSTKEQLSSSVSHLTNSMVVG
ncbi:solute carrier organic anion transporter family member 1C1 isoform X1 [Paramisgurnus dabryanus]|uniref:solute carrier organic anion transporter family member 1C1 isoform X1 n=1 Tax=Paramisgurnus dabryanus TaxID=90735 RepID=UPI0031F41000